MKKLSVFFGLDEIEKFSKNDTKDLIKLSILFFITSVYTIFYSYTNYKNYLGNPSNSTLLQNAKGSFIVFIGVGCSFLYFFVNIFLSKNPRKKLKSTNR